MAVIQMPSRGKKDETGMITKWYKKTGDWVAEGDELFSFDTDDGSYTVKSQKAGRLVAIFVPEGELVHCPTDVGMLSSPSPESVLHLGRMQFVDEEKPRVAPHADPEPISPEAEAAPLAEPAPEAEEAPAPQAEAAPLAEAAPAAEPTPEAEEAPEELGDAEPQADEAPAELDSSAQEGADEIAPEEDAQPAEAEPEEDAPGIALSFADMEPEEADEEEARAAGAEAAEDGAPESEAPQEETAEETMPEQEPEQPEPEAAAAEPARPASLTRRVDVALCQDIAARTGVTLAAMVRFAALRSAPAGLLAPLEDETLRGMSAQQDLPNVQDLGKWGVVRAQRTGAGELCFLVPAAETARRKGEAVEWVPTLELTLCFDEAKLSLEEAARFLGDTCRNLENFWDLLL